MCLLSEKAGGKAAVPVFGEFAVDVSHSEVEMPPEIACNFLSGTTSNL